MRSRGSGLVVLVFLYLPRHGAWLEMFSGVIPGCLALHSISQARRLCLGQAAAGDSAPVSAVSCPCPSVLMPAQAWEAAAAPAWALLSVEESWVEPFSCCIQI